MSIYLTGDLHGNIIDRFSYKRHRKLRQLTNKDTVIVLGDIGLGFRGYEKEDIYQLNGLNQKPGKTIFIRGNHDGGDFGSEIPSAFPSRFSHRKKKEGDNLGFIRDCGILHIENKTLLMIAGAQSHDYQAIIDPKTQNVKWEKYCCKKNNLLYRIEGGDWWPQEDVNIDNVIELLNKSNNMSRHYDFILSHDAPSCWLDGFKRPGDPARMRPTYAEEFFNEMRKTLDFDDGYFGHYHVDQVDDRYDKKLHCLYESIIKIA